MSEPTREELLAENARLKAALAELTGERSVRIAQAKLAEMAHDLRTPLNAIIGFAELLRAGAITEPAERDGALDDIMLGGQRLLKLLNDVIAEARKDTP